MNEEVQRSCLGLGDANGSKASIVEAACCPKRRNSFPKADVDGHHKKRESPCSRQQQDSPTP